MFAQIMLKEPIEKIVEDWDYLDEKVLKHFATFKPSGHNIYGLRRRHISASGVNDPKKGNISRYLELGPNGVHEGDHHPLQLRVTTAGTPHRVSHNFGYWHINDKDELYLPIPNPGPEQLGYYVIMMGLPKENETDSFAWYCEKCLTLLFDFVVETGSLGFNGFWKGEMEAVRSYNADSRHRTCPECGHVNPHGYCWNKAKDSPEEDAARRLW